jgi:tetratricopeptide (TPR) repeat protein
MGLGSTLQEAGRPREGLEILGPAIAMEEQRYSSSPENRTVAHYLALLMVASADCKKDLHDPNAVLKTRRSAGNIFDKLVLASPENYDYRRDKGLNLKGIGEVLDALGDNAGALTLYREALPILEHLPKGSSRGNPDGAIADLRQAIGHIVKK